MKNVTAVMSMLHEEAESCSATRLFRQEPVLSWTMRRLTQSQRIGNVAVLCWEDQLEAVQPIAEEHHAYVLAKGPRISLANVEAIAAARRWSDGWRGGLLGACEFDQGFHGQWTQEILGRLESDGALLADPASGLIDPHLLDGLIEHGCKHADRELFFSQAAPGLCGVVLRPEMLEKLASGNVHPGRILSYLPSQPARDPIASDSCYVVPTSVARSTDNFKMDSYRQLSRLSTAMMSLNGTLATSGAEELVQRMSAYPQIDPTPRELVMELTTNRKSRPVFSASRHLSISRPDLTIETATHLVTDVAADDLRLSLEGVGDPMEHPRFFDFIELARQAGIRAIHLRTDLLTEDASAIERLARSSVDIVSVLIPALSREMYANTMGIDALPLVLENVARFAKARFAMGRGVPILVPTFVKCRQNLAEMESWYDQWLNAVGCAVITGPTDLAGQIPASAVADMSPPRRSSCARLSSRMTVLSNGMVVACEEDVAARMPMGKVGERSARDIWANGIRQLREDHQEGCWSKHKLCAGCREWSRR